jgi:hypothetical protein
MDLLDKIRKIEALIAGTKSAGERQAAELAKRRIQEKLTSHSVEYTVSLNSKWMKRLFVALCQKHGIKTYRYARQRHTTAMLKVSKPFMTEVLFPEFRKYSRMFEELADEIMHDLTSKIHQVNDEDEVIISGELPPPAEALAP